MKRWLCTLIPGVALSMEPVRVEVSRDTWVSSYPTEVEGNNGGSPKLKFKGVQELSLVDIDSASLKGKRVTRAELHLHGEGEEVLQRMTVSSLAVDWVEGDGTSYKIVPGASSFSWAKTGALRWGTEVNDLTAAMNGAGGSIWGFGDASARGANGWQVIPVEPKVVQARIDGASFGFAIMDDVGCEYVRRGNEFTYRNFPNRYVSSRDGKKATRPYFLLWLEDGAGQQTAALPLSDFTPVKMGTLPALNGSEASGSDSPQVRDEFGEPVSGLQFYAARGEAVGFSVRGRATLALEGVRVNLYGMPLVEGKPDPLVPQGTEGDTYVECYVPKDASAGVKRGVLNVDGKEWPCALAVWDFSLADRLSFIPQMNCYGLPGHEIDYYRLAHEHRTTLNCLPYHWTGKIDAGPEIKADGKWDWSKWDAMYAGLFDGSAFRDLPRGAVPTEGFYLMLNENWPMDHEKHFKGGYWVERAYDEAYWEGLRDAAGKVASHIKERGWRDTMFEFYLNNKVSFKTPRWDRSSAAWIFDEPSNTQDFWALRRFGQEFWRGAGDVLRGQLVFRADISRPQWQREMLDGIVNVEVVSGSLRDYTDRVMSRAQAYGKMVYMYGSANAIGTPNVSNAAWCVEAWALGADGVVPWQTVGKDSSWTKSDELSLFYPTTKGPVPSVRLKTFRAGQQLVEYLNMYTALSGQSRASVAAAVLSEPGLRAKTVKKNEADAGKAAFGEETLGSVRSLRLRLGQWLNEQKPKPRDRWHDPRPRVFDPKAVRTITPVELVR